MYRLWVNPGSPQAWEMRLKAGTNTIGRDPGNDLTIEHDSISTFHCRLEVGGERVVIEDLNSTNGTFVNERAVRSSELRSGDTLQLGSIRMLFEDAEPNVPIAVGVLGGKAEAIQTIAESPVHLEHSATRAALTAVALGGVKPLEEEKPVACKNHYANVAKYKCNRCARYVCDLCVNTRGTAGGGQKFCKICGQECVPVIFKQIAAAVDFFEEARRAFRYPVMGDGLVLLFGGSFFFGFLDLANYVSRHGFQYGLRGMMMRVTIFTFIFGTGYLFSYLKKIIAATADGDPHMPDWPELSEWNADIVSPMFQFLILTIVCFGPAGALQIWSEGDYPWLVWPAVLAGCIYFPMGYLGIAMFDSLVALNPKFVIASILRVPREYALAVAVFCGILGVRWALEEVLGRLMKIPLAPALIADLIMIYLLMVESRILGMLYFAEKNRLGWFARNRRPA